MAFSQPGENDAIERAYLKKIDIFLLLFFYFLL